MTGASHGYFRPGVECLEDRNLLSAALPTPKPAPDWFSTNLKDPTLQTLVRQLDADHVLSRTDLLSIFQDVDSQAVVSTTDFSDLKTIVANPTVLGTPAYVENLASKVVNGNPANAYYQGQTLGNLSAGSSGTQLKELVGKWFLGTDLPQASFPYAQASGVLFSSTGPAYQDVRQGYLGDCSLLTALAETVLKTPQAIKTMFIDNGDQTWTVRFYVNGQATYVTVNRYFPSYGGGRFIFANMTDPMNNPKEVLWVALAEKGYAELNASGGLGLTAGDSYSSIVAGYIANALQQISGQSSALGQTLNFNAIVNAWNSGQLIGFCSQFSNPGNNVVAGHAYAVIGVNVAKQTVTLFNPWGINNGYDGGVITLTWNQVLASFFYWDSAI